MHSVHVTVLCPTTKSLDYARGNAREICACVCDRTSLCKGTQRANGYVTSTSSAKQDGNFILEPKRAYHSVRQSSI